MAALALVGAAIVMALNAAVTVLTLREKWRAARGAGPHPLDAALRDIAQAIREGAAP